MTERERKLERLLARLLSVLDHAARCNRCVVEFDHENRHRDFERLKREARRELAPERRPN